MEDMINNLKVQRLIREYLEDNPNITPIKKYRIEPGDVLIPQEDGTFLTYGNVNDIMDTKRFKEWYKERSDVNETTIQN